MTAMLPEDYLGPQEESLARVFDNVSNKLVGALRTIRQIADGNGRSIAAAAIIARNPDVAIVVDPSLAAVAMNDRAEKTVGPQWLLNTINGRVAFQDVALQRWLVQTLLSMARGARAYSDQRIIRHRSRYFRLHLSAVCEDDPRDAVQKLSHKTLALLLVEDLSASGRNLTEALSAPALQTGRLRPRSQQHLTSASIPSATICGRYSSSWTFHGNRNLSAFYNDCDRRSGA